MKKNQSHVVLPGSNRPKEAGSIKVGEVDPNEKIDLTIGLAGPKLPSADEATDVTLTPNELLSRYGAKKSDADEVVKCLKKFGFSIESVSLANRSIRVMGTAGAIEAAFKPNMSMLRSARQSGDYRGRQGTLKIPKELKGIVTGVFGIDERRMARRKSRAAHLVALGALNPMSPSDLEQRYNFPPGDAQGQTIAIAEFGGGYFDDDIRAYCAKFGRTIPNVRPVAVDAPAYTLRQILALPLDQRKAALGKSTEVMLDVEVVAGLCPAATISVYFSTFDEQGWVDLLNEVVTTRPVVLSCSWGLAEEDPNWSAGAIASICDRLNAARLLGITICVSSGDDGSGDALEDGKAHVDFPGSSPFVLSVGGTMLTDSAGSLDEVTWWEDPGRRTNTPKGGGATGGGVSMKFDRPAWQNVRVRIAKQWKHRWSGGSGRVGSGRSTGLSGISCAGP